MGFKNLFKKKIMNESLQALIAEISNKFDTTGISFTVPGYELNLQQEIEASNLLTRLLEIDIWLNYWYDAAVAANSTDPNKDAELYNFAKTYEDRVVEFTDIMNKLSALGIIVGIGVGA